MKLLKTLSVFVLLAVSHILQAQHVLVLEKTGNPRRAKYSVGDQLRFTVENNDTIYDEQISAIFDTAVAFGNRLVPFNTITKVWLGKENFWLARLRVISFAAGSGFLLLDTFNRLVNKDSPVVSRSGIIVFSSGVGLAGVLTLAKKNWFRVNKRHIIKHLDLTIG